MIKRLISLFNQRRCSHVFSAQDMIPRNDKGLVIWPCSKCKKRYKFDYGLQALDHGSITGPWGQYREHHNRS